MKKNRRSILILILSVMMLACPFSSYADGEGNIDGGGGGMGTGTGTSSWSGGDDGVRITIVRVSDRQPVSIPVDFTNQKPNINLHFGKVSKIAYNGGRTLSPHTDEYRYYNPGTPMPRIISTEVITASIEQIKRYFCSEYMIMMIAEITEINYERLISGDYKILLEPIAYIKFQGIMVAVTATEAALYDEQCSGALRIALTSLTHKNLPLSMFLEMADLGYPAWSGSRTNIVSNADIKSYLGLGIVRFTEADPTGEMSYDYEYRTGTEVITAVTVSGGQSDPDNPVSIRFEIGGNTYRVNNVYYPSGDSQLAWVRWTTPDTPQDMTIQISASGTGSLDRSTIHVRVVDLSRNPPPNPLADDCNNSYKRPDSTPNKPEKTSASWGIWRPWWHSYWVWHSTGEDSGYWCNHGWWEFDYDTYSASLTAAMYITPDEKSPTAARDTMKSGYGINEVVTATVNTTQPSATTQAQNAVTYFPEFSYAGFWRLLDRTVAGYEAKFEFKRNPYSTYNRRTHFTPIWFPDGPYTPYTWLTDSWTPAGMLSMNLTDSVNIQDNLWTDWHIAPVRP